LATAKWMGKGAEANLLKVEIVNTRSGRVTTLQIGSYSGLDSSPYGIPSGNHIEDRPVYLVYYR